MFEMVSGMVQFATETTPIEIANGAHFENNEIIIFTSD
jgi:hypothetical protein